MGFGYNFREPSGKIEAGRSKGAQLELDERPLWAVVVAVGAVSSCLFAPALRTADRLKPVPLGFFNKLLDRLDALEGLREVRLEVVKVFDSHGKAHEVFSDAEAFAVFRREISMRGDGRI